MSWGFYYGAGYIAGQVGGVHTHHDTFDKIKVERLILIINNRLGHPSTWRLIDTHSDKVLESGNMYSIPYPAVHETFINLINKYRI